MEKRWWRLAWTFIVVCLIIVCIWVGCPGPPRCYLPYGHYSPLVAANLSTTPPPYPVHTLPPNDMSTLIDLQDFSFLTDRSCNSSAPPLIIALVHSAPGNTYNRRMIRETWGREVQVMFMVGETDNSGAEAALRRENDLHKDLVRGSFHDSYRNLTYKHVMGLKWAAYKCPGARYLLKTDDDVFVNAPFLYEFLRSELSPLGARRLILCNVKASILVKRSYRSKWRVSPEEYPGRWYPRYCTGWTILYSPDVAFLLYTEAQRAKYFWIDDVHITGVLVTKTNLTHTPLGSLSLLEKETEELISSRYPRTDFLFALSTPQIFPQLWDMVNRAAVGESRTHSHTSPVMY